MGCTLVGEFQYLKIDDLLWILLQKIPVNHCFI